MSLVLAEGVTLFCIVDGLSHYEGERNAPHYIQERITLAKDIRLMRMLCASSAPNTGGSLKVLMTAPKEFRSRIICDIFDADMVIPEDALDLQWEEVIGEQLEANYGIEFRPMSSCSSSDTRLTS